MKGLGPDCSADVVPHDAIYTINKSVGMNEIFFFFSLDIFFSCKVWAVKFDVVFRLLSQACRSRVSPPVPPRTDDL